MGGERPLPRRPATLGELRRESIRERRQASRALADPEEYGPAPGRIPPGRRGRGSPGGARGSTHGGARRGWLAAGGAAVRRPSDARSLRRRTWGVTGGGGPGRGGSLAPRGLDRGPDRSLREPPGRGPGPLRAAPERAPRRQRLARPGRRVVASWPRPATGAIPDVSIPRDPRRSAHDEQPHQVRARRGAHPALSLI